MKFYAKPRDSGKVQHPGSKCAQEEAQIKLLQVVRERALI